MDDVLLDALKSIETSLRSIDCGIRMIGHDMMRKYELQNENAEQEPDAWTVEPADLLETDMDEPVDKKEEPTAPPTQPVTTIRAHDVDLTEEELEKELDFQEYKNRRKAGLSSINK